MPDTSVDVVLTSGVGAGGGPGPVTGGCCPVFIYQPGGAINSDPPVYVTEARLKTAWDAEEGPKTLVVDTSFGAASLALAGWDFNDAIITTQAPGDVLTLTGAFTMTSNDLTLEGAVNIVQDCAVAPWTMTSSAIACNIDFGSSIRTNPGKAVFGNVPTGGAFPTVFLRDGSGIGGNGNAVFSSQGTSGLVVITGVFAGVNDASALSGTGTNTIIIAAQSGVIPVNTTGGNVVLDPQSSNVNRIETTGLLTSNTTLFVTAWPGLRFTVRNDNTGNFTTTIKATGDPGTGVTIAQGNSVQVEVNSSGACVQSALSPQSMTTATFASEFDNGNSGGAKTVNWNNGQKQKLTLTGAPGCTLTLTAASPTSVGNFLLKLVQGAGGSKTASWPLTVKWPGGTAPTLSTTAGAVDIVTLYFDGTNYYATASLNFS